MIYSFQGLIIEAKEITPKKWMKINLEDNCLEDSFKTPAADEPTPATTSNSSPLENEAGTFNEGSSVHLAVKSQKIKREKKLLL